MASQNFPIHFLSLYPDPKQGSGLELDLFMYHSCQLHNMYVHAIVVLHNSIDIR